MKRFLKSFGHALRGMRAAFRSEPNLRIHSALAGIVVIAGALSGLSGAEWALVILCITLVTGMEILNTAIEKLCDFVSPGYHDKIKLIKDLAAGGVLIVSIGAAIVGLIIFIPRIISWLTNVS